MNWIRVNVELGDHPKMRKLALLLQVPDALGLVVRLWCKAAQYAKTGSLRHVDELDIALWCGWTGDPRHLVASLVRVGILDDADGELTLHDWEEHQGAAIEKAETDAVRKRQKRDAETQAKRQRFAELVAAGIPADEAAAELGVGRATGFRWAKEVDSQSHGQSHGQSHETTRETEKTAARGRRYDGATTARAESTTARAEVETARGRRYDGAGTNGTYVTDVTNETTTTRGTHTPLQAGALHAPAHAREQPAKPAHPIRPTAEEEQEGRDFEVFWAAYPAPMNRMDAERAWSQTIGQRPPLGELLATLAALAGTPRWQEQGGKFVPAPGHWLRRKGWTERPARASPRSATGTGALARVETTAEQDARYNACIIDVDLTGGPHA